TERSLLSWRHLAFRILFPCQLPLRVSAAGQRPSRTTGQAGPWPFDKNLKTDVDCLLSNMLLLLVLSLLLQLSILIVLLIILSSVRLVILRTHFFGVPSSPLSSGHCVCGFIVL